MSVIVKVSKELYLDDLKASFLPNKLYILPKDVYETYVEKGFLLEYVDSLKSKVNENFFHLKTKKLKVLFTTYQALGDGLLFTPVLKYLKSINKDLYIALETKKDLNLLQNCPYIDEFVYSPLELNYIKNFDLVVNLHMLVGSTMFDLNQVAYYYFKLLGLEIENPDLTPYVYIDKKIDKNIKNLFEEYKKIYKKPILGFHFVASSIHRMPPVDIFCSAIKDLGKFFTIVYSYPSQYKSYADEVKNYLPKAIDISSHIKDINYLAPYVKNLDYLISVETVLPHIAAYTKTPTLTILGPGKFDNIYNYKVPYIKGLEMNYKGELCSSPCQLHISARCPEAVLKQSNLSPCFTNLKSNSLTEKFCELLEDTNNKNLSIKIRTELLNIENKISEIIFKRLSTISFNVFTNSGLAFLNSVPSLRQAFSHIFSKGYYLNKKIVLLVRGYETIASAIFIHKISNKKPIIYVEDEFYKKILQSLGIDSKILDYSDIYIPEDALMIDISFSAFKQINYKTHLKQILQHSKEDTIIFSFVLSDSRLHKYLSKGQDLYKKPFDMFVCELKSKDMEDITHLNIEKIPINTSDFTNVFGEYSIFKEIAPHNQSYGFVSTDIEHSYIYAISNTNYKSSIEELTKFYSLYEKTYLRPDISILNSSENIKKLFFTSKSYLNEYFKSVFEDSLIINITNMKKFGKSMVEKYIEQYPEIEELWFYKDLYIDYFKQDENLLKNLLFGPSINIILEKNPFLDTEYFRNITGIMDKNPKINFYTTQKGVYEILSKKYQNIYYLEFNFDKINAFNKKQKNIDLLIISESNLYNIKDVDLAESFFARYIQNFSKTPWRLVLEFIKEQKDKKDIYYFDYEFLEHYQDIARYSASLNYFIAQEIKDIASKYTKNIIHAGIFNFPDIEFIKDLTKEHLQNSRYIPDMLIADEETYNELMPRSKAIVYIQNPNNFHEIPYFCLKASKSSIPCITNYQKSLENIQNILLTKNLIGFKEALSLVLSKI